MKTIKTVAGLAAVLAVYPQDLPLSFTVDNAPAELATDMQIHQIHRPDAPDIPDVLQISLMDDERDKLKTTIAELAAALDAMVTDMGVDGYGAELEDGDCQALDKGRAALAKHKASAA